MEIGRTPTAAPSIVAATTNGDNVQAVQTILPQGQTVPQAGQSESVSLTFREVPTNLNEVALDDVAREQQSAEREQLNSIVRKEIEIDRDNSVVIFRAIDATTGDVVSQYPEEAQLKLKAYIVGILS